jgi:protoporphyrinogen oxidase
VILLSDSVMRGLLTELNLDDDICWKQTQTGFYAGGKLYSLSTSIDFLKFPILNLYQKFRLGSTIFYNSKIRNWKSLESLSVEKWLRKCSGNSTFEKIWRPLLRAKLGDAYQRTSAAFIWAYIDRMYKARRTGMKREMFGYVPGGYAQILKSLEDHLRSRDVDIVTNAAVDCIERKQDGSKWRIRYGDGEETIVDRVLVTSPPTIAAKICAGLTSQETAQLQNVEYLGVICTSLLLTKPLGGYYVTNLLDDWIPFTGIIEMGSILPPKDLGGHYLVYLPQYMHSSDARFAESDDTIHERAISTLEKMYPNFERSDVTSIQTARAKNVMAIPTLNYSQNLPPLLTSQPGLYLLNSARIVKGTLNVNETLELMHDELDRIVWPNHQTLPTKHQLSAANSS